MYIEIRAIGNRKKYYITHSYRHLGRIRKIRVYLGENLSKGQLEERRKRAEAEMGKRLGFLKTIRDPYQTVLSPSELEKVRMLEAKGRIKLVHLSDEDWLKFSEAFTYDTNAIEGSTVSEREVVGILERNRWPQKPKEEISETYGVAEAVAHIRKTREHVSLQLMKKLHEIVFSNSKPFAGRFRGKGREVVIVNAFGEIVHRGAPSSQVMRLLKKLVEWYDKNRRRYPPLVLAAVVHNQFENIHPFEDGNGRVGRLLLINILIKSGLPPVNIELKNRTQYYSALQEYEHEGNIRPMIELMLKEYRGLKRLLKRPR